MVAELQSVLAKSGIATGVGSLPHRDSREAVAFALANSPELPCIPTLPRRSPAEGMIAQAVVGIQGISTESEAGLRRLTECVDLIRQRQVPAIFPESSVARAAIERVARDSGARLGRELYSDALGASDGPAGSYAGMIRHNIDAIVDALGGSSP